MSFLRVIVLFYFIWKGDALRDNRHVHNGAVTLPPSGHYWVFKSLFLCFNLLCILFSNKVCTTSTFVVLIYKMHLNFFFLIHFNYSDKVN